MSQFSLWQLPPPPLCSSPLLPSSLSLSLLQKDEGAAAALSARSVRSLPGLCLPHPPPSSPPLSAVRWSCLTPCVSLRQLLFLPHQLKTWTGSGCRPSSRRSLTHPVSVSLWLCRLWVSLFSSNWLFWLILPVLGVIEVLFHNKSLPGN